MLRSTILLIVTITIGCANSERVTEHWSNGNRKLEGTLIDGQRHGKWYFYRDWNEDTSEVKYYSHGELYMIDTYTYASGPDSEKPETSTLHERNQILNGVRNGEYTSFRPNRTIDAKGYYLDDLLSDTTHHFSEDGHKIALSVFQRDTSIFFEQFWANGKTRMLGLNGYNDTITVYDSLGNLELKILMDMYSATIDTLEVYNR